MKLTCLQDNLKRGLATVSHAVAGKSTLPVLSNVLLATDEGRLKLAATNLEVGITHWIGAQIQEEGAVTVPAKLLADVIGSLPNDRVTLTLDARTQTLKVECGRFTSNIKGIEADEFPTIPSITGQEPLTSLPPDVLREAIDQVVFAAATDESRPVLAGVLVRLNDTRLFFAAADGFRLATRNVPLPEPVARQSEFIVPARTLAELARIASETQGQVSITVATGGSQVLFHTETTELVSRLIDGRFPDVERIIPQQHITRSVLETSELAKAVKLASYFATASQNVVKLTMEPGGELGPGRVIISANAAEVGDNTGEIDGMIQGEGGQIALNVKYLTELLGAIKSAQITLETQSPQSPGVFKPVGQDGYIHIIMPMSIR
ncbi:DNA polymerase III subunit beta [Candidatus Chloroploca sp. M-50]|uniref:Beta sliding clamp n=1 Tax=Candidatus Chloroploca mongolica TaxID=2528176 RepID=A0ABS4D6Z0_9CHLR|nr:DNA polymerase III subunit beta [Candidatus Chloroploca mongolica]MBP1465203.1 DNA polymerase III subunit beta [Candidatus Chloroploca mongolica]